MLKKGRQAYVEGRIRTREFEVTKRGINSPAMRVRNRKQSSPSHSTGITISVARFSNDLPARSAASF
jgi:single-stranded DNA-binding protein